jgi:ATP-binding cassette, subfamily C, bacterial LapB
MGIDTAPQDERSNRAPVSKPSSRVFAGFLSIGINALALALPLALLQVYDRILPNQSAGSAIVIFSAVVVALVFSGLLRFVRSGIFARWSALEEHRLWSRTARQLLPGHHSREEALFLASTPAKARDVNVGQAMLARFDAPFSIVFLALIAYLGGIVVAAPLLVAVVSVLAFIVVAPRNRSALEQELLAGAQYEAGVTALANSSSNTTTLASLGSAFARLAHTRTVQSKANRTTQNISSFQLDLLQSGALISTVGVVWLGAGEVLAGQMTTGGLAACTLLGSRAASQLVGVAATGLRAQPAAVAAEQSKAILEASGESERLPSHRTKAYLNTTGGGIWVLEASPHQTTSEKLEAIIDHLPRDVTNPEAVRIVSARPRLLTGRLMDCLSRFDKDLEPEALTLSREIGLDSFVCRLPHGYDTELASSGRPLPDGGTKRAAIVQAFAGSPGLVILEAPEASLDVDAVKKLSEFLMSRSDEVKILLQTSSEDLRDGLKDATRLENPRNWIEGVE